MLIVVTFFVGMTVGYTTGSQPIAEVPKAIATLGGIFGALAVGIGFLIDTLRLSLKGYNIK